VISTDGWELANDRLETRTSEAGRQRSACDRTARPVGRCLATDQADQRREGRDAKQDAKQQARHNKVDCKAANQKSNAECRQDKRDTKQDGRQEKRDIKH
jgi:hypothetical protein